MRLGTEPEPTDKAGVLAGVAALLSLGDVEGARAAARRGYPFQRAESTKRNYRQAVATRIFVRDGFVDRYSDSRLVYPGALLLLSRRLEEEFPAHPNWKMSDSHPMYWELWPTIDHVVPVSRGGADEESNWVCTSMRRNMAKGHWTLEELGWTLLPPGDFAAWDGLLGWFVGEYQREPELKAVPAIQKWYAAALAAAPSQRVGG